MWRRVTALPSLHLAENAKANGRTDGRTKFWGLGIAIKSISCFTNAASSHEKATPDSYKDHQEHLSHCKSSTHQTHMSKTQTQTCMCTYHNKESGCFLTRSLPPWRIRCKGSGTQTQRTTSNTRLPRDRDPNLVFSVFWVFFFPKMITTDTGRSRGGRTMHAAD